MYNTKQRANIQWNHYKIPSKLQAGNNTKITNFFFQLHSSLQLTLHLKNLITQTTPKHPIAPFPCLIPNNYHLMMTTPRLTSIIDWEHFISSIWIERLIGNVWSDSFRLNISDTQKNNCNTNSKTPNPSISLSHTRLCSFDNYSPIFPCPRQCSTEIGFSL